MTTKLWTFPTPWDTYLTRIDQAQAEFWERRLNKTYGRLQEMRIWQQVRQRLVDIEQGAGIEPLSTFEQFLLYAATCLCEIGWQSPLALDMSLAERYVESARLIRQSVQPGATPNLGLVSLEPLTVEALARLCAALGQKDLLHLSLQPEPAGYYELIRPRYLAALLQLAEYLVINRANDLHFRRLTVLSTDNNLDARLALQPYISLIDIRDGLLTCYLRLHPSDEERAPAIQKLFEEPIRAWLGNNWEWLFQAYNFRLELRDPIVSIVHSGIQPEPLGTRYPALRDFLDAFVPGEYLSPDYVSLGDNLSEQKAKILPIMVGQTLDNHYEVLAIVGETTHSQVVRARDIALGRDVAIKLINGDVDERETIRNQFQQNLLREARLLAQLDHPHIGRAYAALMSQPGVVMQWIEGSSLQNLIDKKEQFTPIQVAAIGAAIADALDCSHRHGIIHRDIKPGNIILTPTGVPMLIDFDVSRAALVDTITQSPDGSSIYVGSPAYSAPEQFNNHTIVDRPADIFALGVVLYQLLTGQHPYAWGNDNELYQDAKFPKLDTHSIPEELYTLLSAMLHERVNLRPSAREIHEVLHTFTVSHTASANMSVSTNPIQMVRSQEESKGISSPRGPSSFASIFSEVQANIPAQVTLRFLDTSDGATINWDGYAVGSTVSQFVYPFPREMLPLVIKALDAVQHPDHPLGGPQFQSSERQNLVTLGLWQDDRIVPQIHQVIGTALYQALTKDVRGARAIALVRETARYEGRTLSYELRFPNKAVELAALPWELLWDERQAILFSRGVREIDWCQRWLDMEESLPPQLPSARKLHILALLPQYGIPESVRTSERDARIKTWSVLRERGLIEWDELSPVTAVSLDDRMRSGPAPDVIHYFGHGIYFRDSGFLVFDHLQNPNGRELVDARRLAARLGGLRLILLHACQSAMVLDPVYNNGLLTGIAPSLCAVSEAVVAMQLSVRITAATRFLEVFWAEMAHGRPIQAAVAEARRSLYVTESDGSSWYVPTLYVRAREQKPLYLFDSH